MGGRVIAELSMTMPVSRRQLLKSGMAAGFALVAGGCGAAAHSGRRPGVPWPHVARRPDPTPGGTTPRASADSGYPSTATGTTAEGVIPRSAWTRSQPIRSRVNPMGGVRSITLHHEGMPDMPVHFTDRRSTIDRLELVRRSHMNRGWGDIGYHYIIDRAGNVWQARPLDYQGAHVRDHNEHNIGVMLLGNFEIQHPSDAQVRSMRQFVRQLSGEHNVPSRRIHTHQELGPTSCPGRHLQPKIASLRNRGALA